LASPARRYAPVWFAPNRITLVGRSEKGTPVHVTFPRSRVKELAGYSRGQFVTVAGAVFDPPWGRTRSRTISTGIISVTGRTVAPAAFDWQPFTVLPGTTAAVFVVDARHAAARGARDVVRSVVKAIGALDKDQRYCVVFYGPRQVVVTPSASVEPPSRDAEKRLQTALARFRPVGNGDVIGGLQAAFKALLSVPTPSSAGPAGVIYLVAGADFDDNDAVREWLRQANAGCRHQIHTICARRDSPKLQAVLKQIAAENAGRFAHADGKGDTPLDKPAK